MGGLTIAAVQGYVGANVRRLREERGLTQEALAETAGLDVRQINRAEGGRHAMNLGTLVMLANALNVSPAALLQPANMPEIKRGRPRKRPAPADAAPADAAPAPGLQPTPSAASAAPAPPAPLVKRVGRKASAAGSTPGEASTGRKASAAGSARRKRAR